MTGVLIRIEKFAHIHREIEEKQPCDDRGRDWSDIAADQGTPRIGSHH